MKRKYIISTIILLLIFCVGINIAITNRRRWLWMPFNPQYTLNELRGMSPEQVKAKLGPADYDPYLREGFWEPSSNNPYYVAYYGLFGATCVIKFDNGHVSQVQAYSK